MTTVGMLVGNYSLYPTGFLNDSFEGFEKKDPYSTKYRLPGEKTPSARERKEVTGPVRKAIVQALTFHGISPHLDQFIEKLPPESVLWKLSKIQKSYLSFTVYILKQMVATGTISPKQAWILFYWQLKKIPQVNEGNYSYTRKIFWQNLRNIVKKDLPKKNMSLLEFEFYARAGKAGFAHFESFQKWSKDFKFYTEIETTEEKKKGGWTIRSHSTTEGPCENLSEAEMDEYKKTLWLEMRILEDQYGVNGLQKEIDSFQCNQGERSSRYSPIGEEIITRIDLFDIESEHEGIGDYLAIIEDAYKSRDIPSLLAFSMIFPFAIPLGLLISKITLKPAGSTIDSGIKAEIGHWIFGGFPILSSARWLSELMDRMNISSFTPRVNMGFDKNISKENLPPEVRTFREGGFYLQTKGIDSSDSERNFPTYPAEPPERIRDEPHVIAEYFERLIRKKIIEAVKNNEIEREEAFKTYRKTGLYVVLLVLEGKTGKEIDSKLENFNLKEINDYYASRKMKFTQQLGQLLIEGQRGRGFYYTDIQIIRIIERIGDKTAIPILEKILSTKEYQEYSYTFESALNAYVRINGQAAIPFLEELIRTIENEDIKKMVIKTLKQLEKGVKKSQ